jgi:uncharacterized protein YbjT (DUF2867 family)
LRTANDIVLVIDATGSQGYAAARLLLNRGFKVRAMTKSPHCDKAIDLTKAGASVIYGHMDDPSLLYRALDGAKSVLFTQHIRRDTNLSQEETRAKRLAYLAKEQDVYQYIYSPVASDSKSINVPHFAVKERIEKTIRDLKFQSYTFLRHTFCMEFLLDPFIFPELNAGKIITPIQPDTKLQMLSADDLAKFMLYSIQHPTAMNGAELDLAGDEHTFGEMVEVLSSAFNKQIEYTPMRFDDFAELRNLSENSRHDFKIMVNWWESMGWDVDIGGLMLASRTFGIEMETLTEWGQDLATKCEVHSQTLSIGSLN